jgi:S-adenosylmethionine hydrolase
MLTLTTDFGTTEYVAQMKGVVFGIHPAARIVDVSHEILPQNVLQGAYVLASSVPYFPAGSVHVGVVDPGVGGERRAIAIRCADGWLVGPDNGLLWPAAEALGVQETRELTNTDYFRASVSPTFHGRDVFAPVAAHLAAGGADVFADLGRVVDGPIPLSLDEGSRVKDGTGHGIVLHVDRFGNIITNIPGSGFQSVPDGTDLRIRFEEMEPVPIRRVTTYGQAGPDQVVGLVASSGFFEVAMNEDDAAARLDVRPGMPVDVARGA